MLHVYSNINSSICIAPPTISSEANRIISARCGTERSKTHPNQLPSSSARLRVSSLSLPSSISVNVAGTVIPLSDRVKILGATLDSNLSMDNHTKSVSKSCFYHIRSLDDDMAISVASAIVSSRLDYANSILLGCTQKHRPIARLQRAQNTLAIVQPQSSALPLFSSSHLLQQLHWLPVLLTGGYVLNCLISHLKLCIQVARNISPIYCTSINPLGLCVLNTLNY